MYVWTVVQDKKNIHVKICKRALIRPFCWFGKERKESLMLALKKKKPSEVQLDNKITHCHENNLRLSPTE